MYISYVIRNPMFYDIFFLHIFRSAYSYIPDSNSSSIADAIFHPDFDLDILP